MKGHVKTLATQDRQSYLSHRTKKFEQKIEMRKQFKKCDEQNQLF